MDALKHKKRQELGRELLIGCPSNALEDHLTLTVAIKRGDSKDEILNMPVLKFWPCTYHWIRERLED